MTSAACWCSCRRACWYWFAAYWSPDDLPNLPAFRGGVALDNWTRNSAHVHIALDTPIAARVLRPALERYVRQLGLGVLLGVIQADNAKSIRLAEHFGFEQAYRLRDGWDEGRDLLFFEWRKR